MEQWCRYWFRGALRLVGVADQLLGADRWGEACTAYLAAVDLCALSLREHPAATDLRALDELCAAAFRAAIPLLPHAVTTVRTVVGTARIDGYLFAAPAPGPAGTVVYVVDHHETPETCYRPVALPVADLGMAALVVEVSPDPAALDDRTRSAVEAWLRTAPGVTGEIVRFPIRT